MFGKRESVGVDCASTKLFHKDFTDSLTWRLRPILSILISLFSLKPMVNRSAANDHINCQLCSRLIDRFVSMSSNVRLCPRLKDIQFNVTAK